jgi:hypothetical protein
MEVRVIRETQVAPVLRGRFEQPEEAHPISLCGHPPVARLGDYAINRRDVSKKVVDGCAAGSDREPCPEIVW